MGDYRFHQKVGQDFRKAENYYLDHASKEIADSFYSEFMATVAKAAENPGHAHFDVFSNERRVNLKRFPYHFLYRIYLDYIFVFVLRHDKQHPQYGLRRKR